MPRPIYFAVSDGDLEGLEAFELLDLFEGDGCQVPHGWDRVASYSIFQAPRVRIERWRSFGVPVLVTGCDHELVARFLRLTDIGEVHAARATIEVDEFSDDDWAALGTGEPVGS